MTVRTLQQSVQEKGVMSTSEDGEGNINNILEEIGVPGRYQLHNFFWTFLIGVVSSFLTVAVTFTQADMNFR